MTNFKGSDNSDEL